MPLTACMIGTCQAASAILVLCQTMRQAHHIDTSIMLHKQDQHTAAGLECSRLLSSKQWTDILTATVIMFTRLYCSCAVSTTGAKGAAVQQNRPFSMQSMYPHVSITFLGIACLLKLAAACARSAKHAREALQATGSVTNIIRRAIALTCYNTVLCAETKAAAC